MTKKKTLINERVIRRWGKLASIAPLTENWLDEQDALEDEEAAAHDEFGAGEAEVEAGAEAEVSVEEEAAVERIVSAVVDAISDETGVNIEVEGEAGDEPAMDAGMDDSAEFDDSADAEMEEPAAAMRNSYNRNDITETGAKDTGASADDDSETHPGEKDFTTKKDDDKKTSGNKPGTAKGEKAFTNGNRKDEALDIDVIDDEALTEAVLKRVVERLLRRK